MTTYHSELEKLVERAKQKDPKAEGLNLGERYFVELLHFYIGQYRVNNLSADELKRKKKALEQELIKYWNFEKIFRQHTEIRNRQSQWFIEAEKSGCPICKRLIRIFDGREQEESNNE